MRCLWILLIFSSIFTSFASSASAQSKPSLAAKSKAKVKEVVRDMADTATNLSNAFNAAVGGFDRCDDAGRVTIEELDKIDTCTNSSFGGNRNDILRLAYYSEQLILNDLAEQAEASVDCHRPFLTAYVLASKTGAFTPQMKSLNAAAYERFTAKREALTEAHRALRQIESRPPGLYGERPTQATLDAFQKKTAELKLKRDALTVDLPLGSTESMRTALFKLIESGKTDEASFQRAFAAGVTDLKTGMDEFKAEMKRGRQELGGGTFFYNFEKMPKFREDLMMSDRYPTALTELGATPSAKRNLLCRRDAEFVTGRARTQKGLMALSILSIGASFGTSAVIAGAAEGTALAVTARTSHLALQMGVAAVDVATLGSSALTNCTDSTSVIPAAPHRACSDTEVFDGILKRADASSCYASLGTGAAALTVPIAGTALVTGTKAFVARVGSKFSANPQLDIWRLAERGDQAASRALRTSVESHLAEAPIAEMDTLVWGLKPIGGLKVPAKVSKLGGYTGARLVTFNDGTKAIWKPTTGRRSYSIDGEVGTYAIDAELGSNLVPVTVKRTIDGREGTLQLFVDGADDSLEKIASPDHLRWFDSLIRNSDRHAGNYLSVDGRTIAIDHGVSLRPDSDRLFSQSKNVEFDRSVKQLIAEKKSPVKFLPARDSLPKAKNPDVQEILEQYRDIRYEGAGTLRARAETLLPPKAAYEKLVATNETKWRRLLERSGTSSDAIDGFLARRRTMIESVEAAKKAFGPTILTDTVKRPTLPGAAAPGPVPLREIEIKRAEMNITDADLFKPLTPEREKQILFHFLHEDAKRVEAGRGASFYDR